ncbi:hypothetical protein EB001_12410 [bacterium]|jgi:hypothetical protein|nr:hypothetical protein [bacterium]
MKIAYTKNNTSKPINFINDSGSVFAKWDNEISTKSSIGLSVNEIKKYLMSPSRLISEGNNIYITINNDGNINLPIFKMIETYPTKMGGYEFIKYKTKEIVGQIYVPFKDSSDDEYAIRLNVKEEDVSKLLELIPDAVEVANTEEAFKEFYYSNSPRLKVVDTSDAGEWTKIKVQLTLAGNNVSKSDVRIFAKSASGYISNREVYTDANGIAEFKVLPYGLEQGESMKVEFGFKYVSNIVSKDVQA